MACMGYQPGKPADCAAVSIKESSLGQSPEKWSQAVDIVLEGASCEVDTPSNCLTVEERGESDISKGVSLVLRCPAMPFGTSPACLPSFGK